MVGWALLTFHTSVCARVCLCVPVCACVCLCVRALYLGAGKGNSVWLPTHPFLGYVRAYLTLVAGGPEGEEEGRRAERRCKGLCVTARAHTVCASLKGMCACAHLLYAHGQACDRWMPAAYGQPQ